MAWIKKAGMPKIERTHHVIDAEGKAVGRLASEIAKFLQGKHKATYVPHIDAGDFVDVINGAKVKLTGKKLDQKMHFHASGRPGGIKQKSMRVVLAEAPERVLEHAVRYMLPKNKQQTERMKRLKITK